MSTLTTTEMQTLHAIRGKVDELAHLIQEANTAGFPNAIWPFGPNSPLGIVLNVCVGDTVTPPPTGFPAGGQTFPVTSMVVSSVKWTIP